MSKSEQENDTNSPNRWSQDESLARLVAEGCEEDAGKVGNPTIWNRARHRGTVQMQTSHTDIFESFQGLCVNI